MDVVDFTGIAESVLLGNKVTKARLGYGAILLLDLEAPDCGASSYLRIECAWRLEEQLAVKVASEDAHELLARHVSSLNGRVVRGVTVAAPGLDLNVVLDGAITLRAFSVFANTEEYENWTIHTPDGKVLVAGPGSVCRVTSVDSS